jgi:uncharacterized membrane protein YfcA
MDEGLSAGCFGGHAGLGGGAVMVPLVVSLLGLTQHRAHSNSLVALVLTSLAGALAYAFHRHVDVLSVLILAAAALWPARFGAQCCRLLSEVRLKRSFGYIQILAPGIILGAVTGGRLAQFLTETALRTVSAAVLIGLGVRPIRNKVAAGLRLRLV